MRSELGFVRSSRTRSRIQQWFRLQARDQNLAVGRSMLEREFKRLALTAVDYKALANHFRYPSVEDMYVAAGAGDLGHEQVIAAAQQLVEGGGKSGATLQLAASRQAAPKGDGSVSVRGVGQLLPLKRQLMRHAMGLG